MKIIQTFVLVFAILTSSSTLAAKFPPVQSIGTALAMDYLGRLPLETQKRLIALDNLETDPYAVADILLDVLIKKSSLRGVIVPVTDQDVLEVQDHAEDIFKFLYRDDEVMLREALRYWNVRNRYSAIGFPVQWSAPVQRASFPIAALIIATTMYWWWQSNA